MPASQPNPASNAPCSALPIPLWMRLGWLVGRVLRLFQWRRKPTWLILKPGSLGDALLFTGVLIALTRQQPGVRMVLATNRRAATVFQRIPSRGRMLVLDDSLGKRKLASRVQRIGFAIRLFCRRYDVVLYPVSWTTDQWSKSAYSLLDATRKFHLAKLFSDNAVTPAGQVAVSVPPLTHELDKMAAIFRAAGGNAESRADIWPDIGLTERERAWARSLVNGYRLSGAGGMEHGARSGERGAGIRLRSAPARLRRDKAGSLGVCGCVGGDEAPSNEQRSAGRGVRDPKSEDVDTGSEKRSTKHYAPSTQHEESNNQSPITDNHAHRTLRVAVCAGARYKQKDWGGEKFGELFKRMAAPEFPAKFGYDGLELLLLGEKADWESNEKIIWELGARSIERGSRATDNEERRTKNEEHASAPTLANLAGTTSIRQSVAVIAECDLCIGNDTFGLHAAISEHVPSVVILGRQAGDLWSPWGDPSLHRAATLPQFTCEKPGCGASCPYSPYRCIESILVDHVLAEVETVIR